MSDTVKVGAGLLTGPIGAQLLFGGETLFNALIPDVSPGALPLNAGGVSVPSVGYSIPLQGTYGQNRVGTTLIWINEIDQTATEDEILYNATFAVLISDIQIKGVAKIWLNGKLFYENRPYLTGDPKTVADDAEAFFTVYLGDKDQAIDPNISAAKGALLTPAYRNRSYIVFSALQLKDFNNQFPTVEVQAIQYGSGAPTGIVSPASVPLHFVIGDLLARVGLDETEYDCTQLTDNVTGFITNRTEPVNDTLDKLALVYGFYYYDNGRKLVFVKQPNPIIRPEHSVRAMINEDNLMANAYHDLLGRDGYFPESAGSSEGQFLMIRAAAQAYHAEGTQAWLDLAEDMYTAADLLYRQATPASGSGIVYAPHWLFTVRQVVQAQSSILAYPLKMYSVDWLQRGSVLTPSDAGASDEFGAAIALDGKGVVKAVGAPEWDGGAGAGQGAVYVYDWNGSAWVQRSLILTASDAGVFDKFGAAVALSDDGTVLAVGATGWDGLGGTEEGSVYVYDWSGSVWVQRGSVIVAGTPAFNKEFGSALAFNEDVSVLIVGARQHTGGAGTRQGAVYTLNWSGSAWIEDTVILLPSDAGDFDFFGSSVALNNNVLAVGATGWDGSASAGQGTVYIFDYDGSTWVERSALIIPSDASSDGFGVSVALDDKGIALFSGATGWDGSGGNSQGVIYGFDWNGSAWVERSTLLTASDADTSDLFGSSVAVDNTGIILAVGATGWDGGAGSNQGGVYVFDPATDTGPWRGVIKTGPGNYGDLVKDVTKLYDDVDTFTTWENPFSDVIGTDFGIPSAFYVHDKGTTVFATRTQLTKATVPPTNPLTVNAQFIVDAGPLLGVSEMMEAWPHWRRIDPREIDCAVDTLAWAYEAFDLLFAITTTTKYSNSKILTGETIETIFDIDDGRNWIRPTLGSIFSLAGVYISATRGGFSQDLVYKDINNDTVIYVPAGTGEAQFGRGLTDVTKVGDTHIRVIIKMDNGKTVDLFLQDGTDVATADRYYTTLTPTTTIATYDTAVGVFDKRQLQTAGWVSVGTGLPSGTTIDVVGLIYEDPAQETITLRSIRPIPEVQLPFTPGVAPYTSNSLDGTLVDWRGSAGIGYQDPFIWDSLSQPAYLTTMVDFIEESQDEYNTLHSILGPFIPSYAWDRFDTLDLGTTVDTWTWDWPDPNSEWVGYTARVVAATARTAWLNGDSRCNTIALNFLTWLDTYWTTASQFPPTNFPPSITEWAAGVAREVGDIIEPVTPNARVYKCTIAGVSGSSEPTFSTTLFATVADGSATWETSGYKYSTAPIYGNYNEPHAVALFLRAAGYLHANGTSTTLMVTIMTRCFAYLETRIQSSGTMSGTWSSDPANNDWFGFWGAEIITTLSLLNIVPDATVADGLNAQRVAASISTSTVSTRITNYLTWLIDNKRVKVIENFNEAVIDAGFKIDRKQDSELPKEVNASYFSESRNGGTSNRYRRVLGTESSKIEKLSTQSTLTAQFAQDMVLRISNEAWTQRTTVGFNEINRLAEAGDIREYVIDGINETVQFREITTQQTGELQVSSVMFDRDAYDFKSQPVFDVGGGSSIIGLDSLATSTTIFLDIALLSDSDAPVGYYVGVSASTDNWSGAVYQRSSDTGVTFKNAATLFGETFAGTTAVALAANDVRVIDRSSTLAITMSQGVLSSVTELQMLNGANLILIGNEIVQFQTAVLSGANVYTISNLLRGRRGTEFAIFGHVAVENCYLLDSLIKDVTLDTFNIGLTQFDRMVTSGEDEFFVSQRQYTYASVRSKPYSPVHLVGVRATAGEIDLSWVRRAKVSGGWNNNIEVPLDESVEHYRVKLYDALPGGGGALLATVANVMSATTYTLPSATINTHYGSPTATVYLSINQVGDDVGDGYIIEKEFS